MNLEMMALTVPFLGTALGAGAVLGLPQGSERIQRRLNGFAAGAMASALFWNLLLPGWEAVPMAVLAGFLAGMGFILAAEEIPCRWGRNLSPVTLLMMALVLHNIPEGLAVGVSGEGQSATMIGIAVQNIPDGAVAAVPLAAMGWKKSKAFAGGVLSGLVEPVAAMAAMRLRNGSGWLMPGMMGFAAGAMMYVLLRELVPRMEEDRGALILFGLGFGGIMALKGIT